MKKLKSVSFFAAVVLLAMGFIYFALAWTEPTEAPPGGNVPAPVNVGSSTQTKSGGLNVQGDMGVGTTSPERKLHIGGGNILLDNTRTLEAKNAAGAIETWMWPRWSDNVMYTNYGSAGWNIRNNSSVSTMFMTNTGNNVGIGTTGPSAGLKLDVEGKVGATEYCDQNGANCKTIASLGGGSLWSASGNNISNTNTDNVGIGTTGPGFKLDVNGSIRTGSSAVASHFYSATYSVPIATAVTINLYDGVNTLQAGYQYRIKLVTIGTATPTGAVYIVYRTAFGTWAASMVSANGTTSNHPLLQVSGTSVQIYHNHASSIYTISTLVEGFFDGNTTGPSAATFFGLEGAMTNLAGRVGIGTTAPSGKLHIADGATRFVFRDSDSTSAYTTTFSEDNTGLKIGHNSASRDIQFQTNSNTKMTILGGGNVGIGTDSPSYKLDVNGNARMNKLYVTTIDPVYEIDGRKYATYVSDFAGGVRTETSGIFQLLTTHYSLPTKTIDFSQLEKGSDLWLFWQTSNKEMGDLVVILTSGFDGKAWYEKQGNKLIIYGDKAGEVSYRLTLPRKDYEEWGNLVDEDE